jgi:integrase
MKNRMARLTRDNLRHLIATCDPETLAGTRDRYLLALTWAWAAPRSRVAAVRIEDITPAWFIPYDDREASRWRAALDIAAGKPPPDWLVGFEYDLGEWHQDWLTALTMAVGAPVLSGPLFWSITSYDTPRHAGMTGDAINDAVQRAVHRAVLPEPWRYSAHSLRLGGRDRV